MQLIGHLVKSLTLASTAVQIMSFESVSGCGGGLARDFSKLYPFAYEGGSAANQWLALGENVARQNLKPRKFLVVRGDLRAPFVS